MKEQNECLPAATGRWLERCVSVRTRHEVAPERFDGKHEYEPCICMWDTGATYCGVSDRLVDKWQLPIMGWAEMVIGDNTIIKRPAYIISLRLDDGSEHELVATRHELEGVDVIIGLTLISEGHFRIDPLPDIGMEFEFRL